MEGIGFDPQLVYFVLKPKRAYGEGGGGAAEYRKKLLGSPFGGSFFLGGGVFFFSFQKQLAVNGLNVNQVIVSWGKVVGRQISNRLVSGR